MDYKHQPLSRNSNTFRILSLEPGTFDDDIICSLHENNWAGQDISHYYEAVSYTWGTHADISPITVDGKRFSVTSNLALALRNLRDPSVSRNLWIDAICIDQSNVVEKSAQVVLMRQIYAGARSVLIWLGPEADGSSMAMKYLQSLWLLEGRPSPIIFDGGGDWEEWYKNRVSKGWESGHLSANSDQAKARDRAWTESSLSSALEAFFSRSWWNRAWIVQEVAHAKKATIICGSEKLSWMSLESYFVKYHGTTMIFVQQPELNDPRIFALNRACQLVIARIMNLHETVGWKMTLFSNLSYLSHNQASDPRDKVYGILGLKNNMDHGIIPDYGKLPCQVYIDATRAILKHDSYSQIDAVVESEQKKRVPQFTLNVICKTVRMGASSTAGLPSWVPDWNRPELPWDLVKCYDRIQGFSAAGRFCTLENAPIVEDPSTLIASGYLWDLVDEVSDQLYSSSLQTDDWEDIIRSWTPKNIHNHAYPTGDNAEDAFWRSLLQDRSTEQTARLDHSSASSYKKEYLSWATITATTNTHSSTSYGLRSPDMQQSSFEEPHANHRPGVSFRNLLSRLVGWKFCTSRKGYYGTVPAAAEAGDLICVLHGCCVPVILRKTPSLADHFVLIGAAYVHGIMDGEVIKCSEAGSEIVIKIV